MAAISAMLTMIWPAARNGFTGDGPPLVGRRMVAQGPSPTLFAEPSSGGRRRSGRGPLRRAGRRALRGHRRHRRLDPLRIAEVAMANGPEVAVELVDERRARRDVQADDLLVGDTVEVFHERPQAVAMGGHEDPASGANLGGDVRVPERQEPGDRVLERLRPRYLRRHEVGVSPIVAGEARIVLFERWRRHVVAPPPDADLVLAVCACGLRLVQALEGAVVALVEPPRPSDGE